MIEISKTFTFDAAHHLGMVLPAPHPYARVHGHSFTVTVYLRGTADPKTGWIMDFADLDKVLQSVKNDVDHHFLNDIAGLEQPTLENLTKWLWDRIKPQVSPLHSIRVTRGTLGEGCAYEG